MINPSLLSTIKLFKVIDIETLSWLSEKCTMKDYAKGHIVVNKDEKSSDLMFLLKGQLVVTDTTQDGIEIGLHIIEPGFSFGEISAIDGLARAATVKASQNSLVGFLSKSDFHELLIRAPEIAMQLLLQFSSVIRANNKQRIILSINNVQRRVAALLSSYSEVQSDGSTLKITGLPTQQELAAMANTSRESVSRAINNLVDIGIVRKSGRDIFILNKNELDKIISNNDFKQK